MVAANRSKLSRGFAGLPSADSSPVRGPMTATAGAASSSMSREGSLLMPCTREEHQQQRKPGIRTTQSWHAWHWSRQDIAAACC